MTINLIIKHEKSGNQNKIRVDPRDNIEDSLEGVLMYLNLTSDFELYHKDKKIDIKKIWEDTSVKNEDVVTIRSGQKDENLPIKLWRKRIKNELKLLKKNWRCKSNFKDDFVNILVEIKTLGPVKKDEEILLKKSHRFKIRLDRNYPYKSPEIDWISPIFHPNISSLDGKKNISFTYISNWNFSKNLNDLVAKIEILLQSPEVDKVLDNVQSKEALKLYNEERFPFQ